ncbi:MAG TPA: efflux transporter outer membrane subunit [Phenylobacterium sp.]|nr:efflux transporter outer membrane subunit [Phenylobacterium sp.]
MIQGRQAGASTRRWRIRCAAGAGLAAVWLAGCTVGPDFKQPAAPSAQAYVADRSPTLSDPGRAEIRQTLAFGQPLADDWWTAFHSPQLDTLVREALANNQSLAAVRATLVQAREAEARTRGGAYPQVDFAATASRLKTSLLPEGIDQLGPITNDFTLGPGVTYALDIFGGARRLREQKHALTEHQRYQLDAAGLAITGDVARRAIDLARAQDQIGALEEVLRDDEQTVQMVDRLFGLRLKTIADLDAARSQLAADRALLPSLRQQAAVDRNAIAVLTGKPPGDATPPDFHLDALALPDSLPVSVPSALVRQRPDIRAAEAQLHAASAGVGVATAQLYPSLTLSAGTVQESLSASNLFSGAATGGFVAAGLTAPILHGGELKARRREAVAVYDGAYATYRQTVLESFGQVADVLQALDHDAQALDAQRQSVEAAISAEDAAKAQYAVARVDILQVLNAQRQLARARMQLTQARAQRYLDTVQLFAAMGGGWVR